MEHTQLNMVDLAVFAIIILSAMLALFRGFVRELLSLGAWIGAALITIFGYPVVRPFAHEHIKSDFGADAAAGLGLFCVSLAILIPLGYMVSSLVRGRALTAVDRSLGFVFGLARGALVVCLLFLLTSWVWPEQKKEPEMLAQAHTRPYLAAGADALRSLLPKEDMDKITASMHETEKKAEDMSLEKLTTPTIAGSRPTEMTTTVAPSGEPATVQPAATPASVPPTPPPTPPGNP